MPANIDHETVSGFGEEWTRFNQAALDPLERERIFKDYFRIFPWHLLPKDGGTGADIGCGSGRWAALAAPRSAQLHAVDASAAALEVARANLAGLSNVRIHHASVDALPFPDRSLDFAYSLGVLHHVPNTQLAINSIAQKLKPRAPFLIYLYYAFDNQPAWYRWLWRMSDAGRIIISRAPHPLRCFLSDLIAALVYWPLARLARIIEKLGGISTAWPLAAYRNMSFYTMRTDALDRFGTKLEQRFTQSQIADMLKAAGFEDIRFSDASPYWCAVGIKS